MDARETPLEIFESLLRDVDWAPDLGNEDWRYGTHGGYLRELVDYWRTRYDWRARERAINAWDHFRITIDEVPIHFLHARGRGERPLPLILTHGWPWTFWDFERVLGPLTDPAAHGGDPADAFDVVVPSLPGFGFSTPLRRTGINFWKTADLWDRLMRQALGYERYGAHGGDWGTLVTLQLGHRHAANLHGIHVTGASPLDIFSGERPWAIGGAVEAMSPGSQEREAMIAWERKFASHVAVQHLDPQTLAYALHDSPVGLCAWLIERRRSWGDCRGDVERRFSKEQLLDSVMIYWLTDSFVTSARFHQEAANDPWKPDHPGMPVVTAPTGITLFEPDKPPGPMEWTADYYNQVFLRVHPEGGHFAPAEEPGALVEDIREMFRNVR